VYWVLSNSDPHPIYDYVQPICGLLCAVRTIVCKLVRMAHPTP